MSLSVLWKDRAAQSEENERGGRLVGEKKYSSEKPDESRPELGQICVKPESEKWQGTASRAPFFLFSFFNFE